MAYTTGSNNSVKRISTSGNSNDSSSCNCKNDCDCHENKRYFSMKKVLLFIFLLLVLGSLAYYLGKNSKQDNNII